MIIQGSHLNYSFMQKLQAQKNQMGNQGSTESLLTNSPGMRLRQGLDIDTEKQGLNPAMVGVERTPEQGTQQTQEVPQTLGATLANEIIRRMGEADGENGQAKDNSDLRHSLGQSMDWMRKQFGDEAAAAAAGMLLQATESGVNEETLGEGLVNALKFIDRNFGYAAGDAAIAKLNQSVNPAINDYFDNGKAELFHVVQTPTAEGASATQSVNARFFMRANQPDTAAAKDAASATEQLLESLKKELDEVAGLQDLTTQLEAQFNPAKATPESAIAAYTASPVPMEPQLASMAV